MTAANEKRMTAAIGSLSPRSRAIAVLNAIRDEDTALLDVLRLHTPRATYLCDDRAESEVVEASHAVSLRFDRTWYAMLADFYRMTVFGERPYALLAALSDEQEAATVRLDILDHAKSIEVDILACQRMMTAATKGAEAFAESLGLPIATVFAYSTAIDEAEFKEFSKGEADREDIAAIKDILTHVWTQKGHAIIQPTTQH